MKRVKPFAFPNSPLQPYRGIAPKTDRRSLLLCGTSILFCLTVLFGITFALFNDTVTNQNNRIQTGNLKVGFEVSDKLSGNDLDTNSPYYQDLKTAGDAAIFTSDASNWKPGDRGSKYLKISNTGTMPLDYRMSFRVEDGGLGGALTFTFTKLSVGGEITGAQGEHPSVSGESLETVAFANTNMNKEQGFDLYQMDYVLSESLDNSFNTDTPAFFSMDVTLFAQQVVK